MDVLYHAYDVWTTIKWDIMLWVKCFIASNFPVIYFLQQGSCTSCIAMFRANVDRCSPLFITPTMNNVLVINIQQSRLQIVSKAYILRKNDKLAKYSSISYSIYILLKLPRWLIRRCY